MTQGSFGADGSELAAHLRDLSQQYDLLAIAALLEKNRPE